MRIAHWHYLSTMWLATSITVSGTVAGQAANTTKMSPAVVAGRVVDTAGAALADAEVVVQTRGSAVAAPTSVEHRWQDP